MYEAETVFAGKLADAAGEVILKYFRRPIEIDDKEDTSPVTAADRGSELVMREMIKKEYPACGIVGEEYGIENENAEFVWVLDPIDGTKSFITGKPVFGTLIALLHHGKPVMGVINQPYTKERWIGAAGRKSTFNGKEISVRRCTALDRAMMYSSGGALMFRDKEDLRRFTALTERVKLTRYSSDCYAYGLLAMGCIDIVCEADMKLYDYAALVPVVEGAGGVMSDWNGRPLDAASDGHVLALGDVSLSGAVKQVLDS